MQNLREESSPLLFFSLSEAKRLTSQVNENLQSFPFYNVYYGKIGMGPIFNITRHSFAQ